MKYRNCSCLCVCVREREWVRKREREWESVRQSIQKMGGKNIWRYEFPIKLFSSKSFGQFFLFIFQCSLWFLQLFEKSMKFFGAHLPLLDRGHEQLVEMMLSRKYFFVSLKYFFRLMAMIESNVPPQWCCAVTRKILPAFFLTLQLNLFGVYFFWLQCVSPI